MKDNLFAFYLGASSLGEESDITFGYYDKTKFTGEIQWNPVVFKYMYAMILDDVLINGKSLGVCRGELRCTVTVDSGSSLMGMPRYAYEELLAYEYPASHQAVDCKDRYEFGSLTYIINGHSYSLDADEWVYPPQRKKDK